MVAVVRKEMSEPKLISSNVCFVCSGSEAGLNPRESSKWLPVCPG